MEEAKKRPRPRRSSAKAATEKMKQQRQTPQEKLISKIVTMGFNKEAVELAVYEEGYNESESIVMFLCENPKGYVERKQKKLSIKHLRLLKIWMMLPRPEKLLKCLWTGKQVEHLTR